MYYVIICGFIIFIIFFVLLFRGDDISSENDYLDKDGNHEYYDRKIIRAKRKK